MNTKWLKQAGLLTIAVAALVIAAVRLRQSWPGATGSSDRDRVVLVCLACNGESHVTSTEYNALPSDDDADAVQCPQCGQVKAHVASMRCANCKGWIIRLPGAEGTAFVCPHCKQPLGTSPPAEPANQP